jgi:hypothetical protein
MTVCLSQAIIQVCDAETEGSAINDRVTELTAEIAGLL